MTSVAGSEKTEVVYGTSNVINREIQFFSNAILKVDTCMDNTRPSLALSIESIRKSFLDAKSRNVNLRYITEVTAENISYCKELMKIVEVRHLDGIKGNFMVSEKEYLAPAISNNTSDIASHIIYSNSQEIVKQQNYIFDTLWNKSTPAIQRIKEIEEGLEPIATRLLENPDEIFNHLRYVIENASKRLICSSSGGMQMVYNNFFNQYKKILDKHRGGKGEGIRCLTTIDKDNKDLIKIFLDVGVQIRHLGTLPPMNFVVDDKHFVATIDKMEGGKIMDRLLVSNEPIYINHYNSIFENLWKNGGDALDKITAIEQGLEEEFLEVITDHQKASQILVDLAKSVKKEALFLLPNDKAMLRVDRLGIIDYLIQATRHGAEVKIICPLSSKTTDIVKKIYDNTANGIKILNGADSLYGTFIADSQKFFRAELREPNAIEFSDAIGFTIYSNSRRSAESFKSIFELLWNERTLNEELTRIDKMQQEFINVAAHELRTPIQPILGLSQLLLSKTGNIEQYNDLLSVINRNAKRLSRLSDDILDATKIESKSLELKKEQFNLNNVILHAIDDILLGKRFNGENLQLLYEPHDILLHADKSRIAEVISNLLSNAIKFTKKGTITISVEIEKTSKDDNKNWVIISVKDTGEGIDINILPRLFTKFASSHGTGLGLFISKGIVEAHGGKIWAQNNNDHGATFSFSLPLD
jgi:two-component system, OmpR family, sensor histidine kinase VicK